MSFGVRPARGIAARGPAPPAATVLLALVAWLAAVGGGSRTWASDEDREGRPTLPPGARVQLEIAGEAVPLEGRLVSLNGDEVVLKGGDGAPDRIVRWEALE